MQLTSLYLPGSMAWVWIGAAACMVASYIRGTSLRSQHSETRPVLSRRCLELASYYYRPPPPPTYIIPQVIHW